MPELEALRAAYARIIQIEIDADLDRAEDEKARAIHLAAPDGSHERLAAFNARKALIYKRSNARRDLAFIKGESAQW